MVLTMAQVVVDVAQQTQNASGGGIGSDGWKVISFLCAAIGGMYLWLKIKDKRIDDLQSENVAYLKEQLKRVMDEKDKD